METTDIQHVIGYKGFNSDVTCMNDFQYEVGKTYTMTDKIKLCNAGFHFCMIPIDVLKYYDDKYSKFAIIKATGKIVHDYDKSVCSQITIEKLITLDELYKLTTGKFVRNNGEIEYYQDGKFHRMDGPAIISTHHRWWYKNGELYREDGPAFETIGESEIENIIMFKITNSPYCVYFIIMCIVYGFIYCY